MSMLAGPRRKQKVINLRAKNNEWSNDSSKFGQRMLEKMGWTSGKGLGAKENGIVEHVVARYKNDEKGLGFEDRNDQWTKHEDDFNSLLANLSNANEDNKIKLHSGISLEDKSRKSKARIHYHKFTRGKDLSRYSEKDLANIFGKKSFNEEQEIETQLSEDIKTSEQVFSEKGSMEEYFKNKMAVINSRNKTFSTENEQSEIDWEDEPRCGFQGFLEASSDEILTDENKSSSINGSELLKNNTNDSEIEKLPKIKKKKKKCIENKEDLLNDTEDVPQDVVKPTKKHKKDVNIVSDTNIDIKNKEKIKRHKQEEINTQQDADEHDNVYKPKKKKKRKYNDE